MSGIPWDKKSINSYLSRSDSTTIVNSELTSSIMEPQYMGLY